MSTRPATRAFAPRAAAEVTPGSTADSGLAVVTGAASGIGAAVARRLSADGRPVVLVDRDARVEAVAQEVEGTFVVADVSSTRGWEEVVGRTRRRGRVSTLVNNAAHIVLGSVVDLPVEDWDLQMAVNVRAAFLGVRAFAADLATAEGSIVLMSSVHALAGLPGHPAYAASKGALTALARQLAVDLAPVRVNAVLPGPVLTPAWDGIGEPERRRSAAQTALKRLGTPGEVAAVVAFLSSPEASYVTGASVVVDGGWTIVKDSA